MKSCKNLSVSLAYISFFSQTHNESHEFVNRGNTISCIHVEKTREESSDENLKLKF